MTRKKNEDLHGNVPDSFPAALLIIDMINDLEFDGGEELLQHAEKAAENIKALKEKAKSTGIPVVYVNDNYGKWQSEFNQVVEACTDENVRGSRISRLLRPEDDDYSVIKPKHSGFFSTTLETLLNYLQADRLILTGIQTDICILFTANDAFMRDYELYVPEDCSASETTKNHDYAMRQMEDLMDADITKAAELDLKHLCEMGNEKE